MEFEETLQPTEFIDCTHRDVATMAISLAGDVRDPVARARRLFRAVRDDIRYSVRVDFADREGYRASATLRRGSGFCVQKSIVLVALARAVGIPARLHFADMRNRLVPANLKKLMKTDLFVFHGYVEMNLGGRWVKATPSFDPETCRRQHIVPVEFDGVHDALLHPTNALGVPQFEYVADRGPRNDLPLDEMLVTLFQVYPHYDPDSWETAFEE